MRTEESGGVVESRGIGRRGSSRTLGGVCGSAIMGSAPLLLLDLEWEPGAPPGRMSGAA